MTKEIYKPTIIVDTREKTPWKFNKSTRCNGSLSQKLDTGDYSIIGMEDLFVIERKSSVAEMYKCLGSDKKRFMREMDRILDFKYRFMFLEFDIEDIFGHPNMMRRFGKRTPMKPEYIISQLTMLQVKYGLHIVYLGKGRKHTKAFINKFFQKFYSLYMSGELQNDSN